MDPISRRSVKSSIILPLVRHIDMGIHRVFRVVKDNAIIVNVLHRDCEMGIRRIERVGSISDSRFINSAQDLPISIKRRYVPFQRN